MANILANILVQNSELLIDSMAPGGWLILSGILGTEVEEVADHFRKADCWTNLQIDTLDEWASVRLEKVR